MKSSRIPAVVIVVVSLAVSIVAVFGGRAVSAQGAGQAKYTVRVPNALALSEFKGYEGWQTDPAFPAPARLFPHGSKMAKIHWNPNTYETFPGTTVPEHLHDGDFMVKNSNRFADSGGWGWAAFKFSAASDTFTPFTLADQPPQANDAKCGLASHTIARTKDYVFTD